MAKKKARAFVRNIAEVPWQAFPRHFGGALSKPLVEPATSDSTPIAHRPPAPRPMPHSPTPRRHSGADVACYPARWETPVLPRYRGVHQTGATPMVVIQVPAELAHRRPLTGINLLLGMAHGRPHLTDVAHDQLDAAPLERGGVVGSLHRPIQSVMTLDDLAAHHEARQVGRDPAVMATETHAGDPVTVPIDVGLQHSQVQLRDVAGIGARTLKHPECPAVQDGHSPVDIIDGGHARREYYRTARLCDHAQQPKVRNTLRRDLETLDADLVEEAETRSVGKAADKVESPALGVLLQLVEVRL